ncbi:MAG: imelysin family protein [Flavobacteriales bacterium]|nr:imelysin family protein [Flavobacteriales bacterium]
MKQLFFIASLSLLLYSCKKNNDTDEFQDNFDRSGLLNNLASNVIVPNYNQLQFSLDSLVQLTNSFVNSPGLMGLESMRDQWKVCYKDWMHCSMFEFGPAADVMIRQNLNTFPTDTVQIKNNIIAGTWDFNLAANIDAIGFPSVDYLLNRRDGNDALVMNSFTIDANAAARKNYLVAVVLEMKSKIDAVVNGWSPAGSNYYSTFVNSLGTDVGSSLGFLVNQLNYDYEITKNPRIGIPLGKQTLDVPLPEKCEAYFAGFSMELAIEHISAINNVFCGKSRTGIDGSGLDDYVDYLGATSNGSALSVAVKNKLNDIIVSMQAINGILSDAVVNEVSGMNVVYTKLLEALILLKTDVPGAIGILITYQDTDGD